MALDVVAGHAQAEDKPEPNLRVATAATQRGAPAPLSRALETAPVRFEAATKTRFVARGPNYTYGVEPTETFLALSRPRDRHGPPPVVKMRLVGANTRAIIAGEDEARGRSNYFIGPDSKHWRSNVVGYGRVRVRGVYPGIDLVHYGSGRQLEYDFVVAPHANPRRIRMRFEGATRIAIDETGDLLLETAAGTRRHKRPRIYQQENGRRVRVDSRFVRRGHDVAFEVGRYDAARAGDRSHDCLRNLHRWEHPGHGGRDAFWRGRPQICVRRRPDVGWAAAPRCLSDHDSEPAVGCVLLGLAGIRRQVRRVAERCASLVYSTYLGGYGPGAYGSAGAWGIAVNPDGSAVVVGNVGDGFPLVDPLMSQPGGGFVARLSANGDNLLYSTYFPGQVRGIALDQNGRYNIVGETGSGGLPTTPGAFMPNALSAPYQYSCWPTCGSANAFVAIIDPALTGAASLVYATYLGGSGEDWANAIAIDQFGKLYVTGTTASFDFPIRNGVQTTLNLTSYACNDQGGGRSGQDTCGDLFLVKLDPSLNGTAALLYSTYLGGLASGQAIAVDGAGHAYVTGSTDSNFGSSGNSVGSRIEL